MNACKAFIGWASISVALFVGSSAEAQIGGAKNSTPATPKEPTSLAEAAGTYVGAVEQLNVLKTSRCGYALKRQIPSFEKVISDEVLPSFPQQSRGKAEAALNAMKKDVTKQGQNVFDQIYDYYTQTEKQDHNTACGFITGSFITLRKLSAEAFERKAKQK